MRGNGASSHGLVFSEGAVLDLNRMKTMEFDEKNWLVKVGPGIAAFDLQREARKRGYQGPHGRTGGSRLRQHHDLRFAFHFFHGLRRLRR